MTRSGYRRHESVALALERLELLDALRQPLRDLAELRLRADLDRVAGRRVADPRGERVLVRGDRGGQLGDPQLDLRETIVRAGPGGDVGGRAFAPLAARLGSRRRGLRRDGRLALLLSGPGLRCALRRRARVERLAPQRLRRQPVAAAQV